MTATKPPQKNGSLVRASTLWRPHDLPVRLDSDTEPLGGVRWLDVTGTDPGAAGALLREIASLCPELTKPMLEALLTPEQEPLDVLRYDDGRARLTASFSVTAHPRREKPEPGRPEDPGQLIFDPVELLASDNWLVSCWHPSIAFSGVERGDVPDGWKQPDLGTLSTSVAKRWQRSEYRTGRELGVLIMNELAFSYREAIWTLRVWLEDWELGLYGPDQTENPDELIRLWGEMAVLRDWLSVLNLGGENARLAPDDHPVAIELDEQLDKGLQRLEKLAEQMRSCFSVLNFQRAEQDRKQSEQDAEARQRLQTRFEVIAAVFLVPTLVLNFYGTNISFPGEHTRWGFWVMLSALVGLTALTVSALLLWNRRARRQ